MTSAVRYSRGYARMRMLKGRLWSALDRPMLLRARIDPDGHAVSAAPADLFPPLVHWYVVLSGAYPPARGLFMALFRLHEIENLKLLWRAALRDRPLASDCWRPLAPLATIAVDMASKTPEGLVDRLTRTPYGSIARALVRSHGPDLPATEIGFDRWSLAALDVEAAALPARESAAARLVRAVIRERDVDLLRRGRSFGLDADLVAKSTVLLSREGRVGALADAATWQPGKTPLWRVLPASVTRDTGDVETWDAAVAALRRARLRACRRTFIGWPYQIAPALAALLLREEQTRAAMSIAAATSTEGQAVLPHALAASLIGA